MSFLDKHVFCTNQREGGFQMTGGNYSLVLKVVLQAEREEM